MHRAGASAHPANHGTLDALRAKSHRVYSRLVEFRIPNLEGGFGTSAKLIDAIWNPCFLIFWRVRMSEALGGFGVVRSGGWRNLEWPSRRSLLAISWDIFTTGYT